MTIFFAIVALVHVFGLFALLLAFRHAPVAVRREPSFMVIGKPEAARDFVAVHARTA
jgi:hypothetical protein